MTTVHRRLSDATKQLERLYSEDLEETGPPNEICLRRNAIAPAPLASDEDLK